MNIYTEQFERRKKLAVYWHNKAMDLRGSAAALWASMHDPQAESTAERLGLGIGFSFSIACWPVYKMLCGISIELLLKASIVAQGKEPKTTHNLVVLGNEAGLLASEEQLGLLQILSASVIWEGKYPVPKTESHFAEHAELQKKFLFEKVAGTGTFEIFRGNDALTWESFNKLWIVTNEIYYAAQS